MEYLSYRHVVNLGDLISALPGVKHLYETTGKKAIIYQQLNRPGEYYIGAQHPTKDANGNMVCFNQEMFDMMRPLLLAQEYIDDFRVYSGEKVDYDLDVVRHQTYCGAPHFPLHKWPWMAYPEMCTDLSKTWITVDLFSPTLKENYSKAFLSEEGGLLYLKDKLIINLTERYRNYNINYFFLKKYEEHIVFAGTKNEHAVFANQWGITVPLLKVGDFYELAQAIKCAKGFIGNQSFCWHLTEAMKVPRVLELYPYAQNCTNFGANGYEFYHQPQLEYYVNKLYNE